MRGVNAVCFYLMLDCWLDRTSFGAAFAYGSTECPTGSNVMQYKTWTTQAVLADQLLRNRFLREKSAALLQHFIRLRHRHDTNHRQCRTAPRASQDIHSHSCSDGQNQRLRHRRKCTKRHISQQIPRSLTLTTLDMRMASARPPIPRIWTPGPKRWRSPTAAARALTAP